MRQISLLCKNHPAEFLLQMHRFRRVSVHSIPYLPFLLEMSAIIWWPQSGLHVQAHWDNPLCLEMIHLGIAGRHPVSQRCCSTAPPFMIILACVFSSRVYSKHTIRQIWKKFYPSHHPLPTIFLLPNEDKKGGGGVLNETQHYDCKSFSFLPLFVLIPSPPLPSPPLSSLSLPPLSEAPICMCSFFSFSLAHRPASAGFTVRDEA